MNPVSRFLTKDDLVSLTGYKRAAEQRRWLVQNGYAFDVPFTCGAASRA